MVILFLQIMAFLAVTLVAVLTTFILCLAFFIFLEDKTRKYIDPVIKSILTIVCVSMVLWYIISCLGVFNG